MPCKTRYRYQVTQEKKQAFKKGGPWVGLMNKWQQDVKYILKMPYAMYNVYAIYDHMNAWHVAPAPCVDFWVVVNSPAGPLLSPKL